jgi:outer membrane protein OmpA-like peptidoglycan-associated protein/opacity protein-like surface antigen
MATYRMALRASFRATPRLPIARGRRLAAAAAIAALHVSTGSHADAQQRKHLLEAGVAGSANTFDKATDLGGAGGGLVRLGVWLPFNFSVEGEAGFASPKAEAADVSVKVRTVGASALYNVPVGESSSAYVKLGIGSTTYGGDCPAVSTPGSAICGSSGALLLGGGVRFAVSQMIMIRGEGVYNRNSSNSINLSNYGANVGVSVMLGGRPVPDSDRDGVLDPRDACAGTLVGAQVDSRGCTFDSDEDGVANGVDRCSGTPAGASVDVNGCPKDSDGDNILDGIDRCPDTRSGVLDDPQGCPRDSYGDGIADGLDRCSATPSGASVDALGCPGDEDADGVLDGLDQCPRSPAGAVDAQGCNPEQARRRTPTPSPAPTPAPAPTPTPTPTPRPSPKPAPSRGPSGSISSTASVVEGVSFFSGTARLRDESFVALDSIAAILTADTSLVVEIGAHSDNTVAPADAQRLTTLQAEAVVTYLAQKGVSGRRLVTKGYGATRPLSSDNTPSGQARNRRIEIRRLPSTP